jgi:hypothetical protein
MLEGTCQSSPAPQFTCVAEMKCVILRLSQGGGLAWEEEARLPGAVFHRTPIPAPQAGAVIYLLVTRVDLEV